MVYNHMDKVFLVMLDRSMWFSPAFEAITADDMKALLARNPRLRDTQASAKDSLTFTFSYAQKVFLCTAIEEQLLQHYINSLGLLAQLSGNDLSSFRTLQQWIGERKGPPSWEEWLLLDRDKKLKMLKGLSLSNLATAQQFFREIYSEDCFVSALTEEGYKTLLGTYQNLQEERNGILHRGGELRDGRRIEASESEIRETFGLATRVRNQLLVFSKWCHGWWINKVTTNFAK